MPTKIAALKLTCRPRFDPEFLHFPLYFFAFVLHCRGVDSLSIILPCYNEAVRLPRTFELIKLAIAQNVFSDVDLKEIWVIDDGSKDDTVLVTQQAQAKLPMLKIHRVEANAGKGNAIHTGLKIASAQWTLVADADSATPWDQFKKLYRASCGQDRIVYPVSIGSRDLPESDIQSEQSFVRETMGKIFNFLVRTITGLPFRDTQCGFKLMHMATVKPFLGQLNVKRFAWDVEFLMMANAHKVAMIEVPVTWAHQEASRVNAIKDSAEMLYRVLQMRFRISFLKG